MNEHDHAPATGEKDKHVKTVISGSTGLVGTHRTPFLTTLGHEVAHLARGGRGSGDKATVAWDPANRTIDGAGLDGADAVVHPAGEGIADGRWTTVKKERIRASRVDGTPDLEGGLRHLLGGTTTARP